MKQIQSLIACLALAATAACVPAHAQEGDWLSYRDAYRGMVAFEKYGKPKQFLQQHYQVSARDGSPLPPDFKLVLSGKSMQLNLPLDAVGRAVFPLLKAAYDENAALTINRKLGAYVFRPRVSIAVRPDGVYEGAELRAACEQALDFQRTVNAAGYRDKHCVGVRFTFAKKSDADVRWKGRDGAPLPVLSGPAFPDEAGNAYSVVTVRFDAATDKGQVISQNAPLALAPVFE
ncbi:hypothetical protein GCM10027277_29010 [Pseudoduganella ginsengisoli]|uniref:DUF2987 domain-containing protein n=1 Tax=Pseudoduganella ginsengisoli TaxID=1462440 RepID=A0A6L6Q1S5_9BURK|nr:hypothetical protein [Pseudoduganella ginsengisoli]MTW03002.1 hypothetical protein [Pseudoduganella ginsengisoli]